MYRDVRDTTPEDIKYLADNLREADLQEIQAASGLPPYEALMKSHETSPYCKVGVADDEPVLIFGVAPTGVPLLGGVWMLGTPAIEKHTTTFLRRSKRYVLDMHDQGYPVMFNYTDCRNQVHHTWLKWLGFKFIRKVNYGVEDRPFYEFVRLQNV